MPDDIPPDYTPISGAGCRVITIEYVVPLQQDIDLDSSLEALRGMGAADVVADVIIAEDWDTACQILDQRRLIL